MTWKKAKQEIKKHVVKGTDVNTQRSTMRIVETADSGGYRIPKGKNSKMSVTWDMLEHCWKATVANGGKYDREAIGKRCPRETKNAPCLVHTIRVILEKAGVI